MVEANGPAAAKNLTEGASMSQVAAKPAGGAAAAMAGASIANSLLGVTKDGSQQLTAV